MNPKSLREVIEIAMKKCLDKGIELGIKYGGTQCKITLPITEIRDGCLLDLEKIIVPEENINSMLIGSLTAKDNFNRGYNQAIEDMKARMRE